ncbi:MAG: DUF4258 domain-containing protein [Actinomycetia bacterium]|nr:DUF4258 domain-containing protein [Actinomycetota bacterium]MCG2788863.1 DUF4258 domain-containing protein [Actinomycetes bacterium]
MEIKFHEHAKIRMKERGASIGEVKLTVETGEKFTVKFERTGFRRNFIFNKTWQGKHYNSKQIEVYAVSEEGALIILTIIVKYF